MTVLSEPGDKGSQRMMMPANGLLGPSRRLMRIEVQGNKVFSVHDNSSLTSVERRMLLASRSVNFGSKTGGSSGRLRRRMFCPLSYWATCLSGSIEAGNGGIAVISRRLK
jgi:hypothetical protein